MNHRDNEFLRLLGIRNLNRRNKEQSKGREANRECCEVDREGTPSLASLSP